MARLLASPRALTVVIVLGVLTVVGIAGGALGQAFGGGFLGAPMAHVQLAAEPVTAKPIFGSFQITNSMVATWAAILFLALVSFLGTRRVKEVPGRLQSLLEIFLETFLKLTESVAGSERGRRFLPLIATIFIFIVTANWMGILPGYGTIGRFEPAREVVHQAEESAERSGDEVDKSKIKLQVFEGGGSIAYLPLGSVGSEITAEDCEKEPRDARCERAGLLVPFLRSANTDFNTPLAIALVAMSMVHWWGLRTLGVSHIGKFINIRGGPIWLFVGVLEGVSEIARVISFTCRLFGNIFAGEVVLVTMAFLVPLVGLVPFLGLEMFVGLIQAFIFSMLTLVFASAATMGHETGAH